MRAQRWVLPADHGHAFRLPETLLIGLRLVALRIHDDRLASMPDRESAHRCEHSLAIHVLIREVARDRLHLERSNSLGANGLASLLHAIAVLEAVGQWRIARPCMRIPCGPLHVVLRRRTGQRDDEPVACLLYTSDAADERSSVDLGGRRIIKK